MYYLTHITPQGVVLVSLVLITYFGMKWAYKD